MNRVEVFVLLAAFFLSHFALAQSEPGRSYSRLNTFSVFTEYSNDSSHIVLGTADNRKLVALGVSYSRRILTSKFVEWQYGVEIRPLVLLRQPNVWSTVVITFKNGNPPLTGVFSQPALRSCTSQTSQLSGGSFTITSTYICGYRWAYAGGLSPLGQKVNFAPHHRVQPFIAENAGFLVSPNDVPIDKSSRFNFAFEVGAGLELYRERGRSVAIEYCIHHLSNDYIGRYNPGVDSGVIKLTYSFSRR